MLEGRKNAKVNKGMCVKSAKGRVKEAAREFPLRDLGWSYELIFETLNCRFDFIFV